MQPLISLDGVDKVFVTDEVETHALAGVQLAINKGRLRVDRRPVGMREVDAARHPRSAGFAYERVLHVERQDGGETECEGSRAHPQSRNRIHLSGIQSDRRSECL